MLNKERFLLPFKLIALGFLAIFFLAACAGTGLPKPPLAVPANLDKVGVIADFKFEVSDHVVYSYYLKFQFSKDDKLERARVRKLLGEPWLDKFGKAREPGVPTPVRLIITQADRPSENIIYRIEIDPLLTSWGIDNFKKMLGHCDLPAGIYRVRLENLRESIEFRDVPINFIIGSSKFKSSFDPKTADRSRTCPQ